MSLDAIGIITRDMKKSIEFYGTLGVEMTKVGEDHYEGTTPSGLRLMLDSIELIKKINPSFVEPSGSGVVLCFKQQSPEEVNKKFETIVSKGFKAVKEPWDAFWGQRYSSVYDPDGNQIDIFSPLN
jgi:catechol 2,3-dioxygenase-like lactoylglutathione lyase family enzyme